LYADRGSKIDGSVMSALRAANDARIILVVDECSAELRSDLTRNFGGPRAVLKIVSIYQDAEDGDRSSEYRLFEVPLLPTGEIEAIIKSSRLKPSSSLTASIPPTRRAGRKCATARRASRML
jgi:hypothetical protein